MTNEHLIPVVIQDMINTYKGTRNQNEKAALAARLAATKEAIEKVIK